MNAQVVVPFRQRARGSGQRAVDPAHFPVATLAARKVAEDAAYALADQLNEKAGRTVAAAKVSICACVCLAWPVSECHTAQA